MQWYPLLEAATRRSFRASAMTELGIHLFSFPPWKADGGVIGAALYALDQLEQD